MPTFSRAWLLGAVLAAIATFGAAVAQTISPQIGGGISQGFDGGISGTGSVAAPPAGGALLLEDGSSILMLEDGTSQLCLEGGC